MIIRRFAVAIIAALGLALAATAASAGAVAVQPATAAQLEKKMTDAKEGLLTYVRKGRRGLGRRGFGRRGFSRRGFSRRRYGRRFYGRRRWRHRRWRRGPRFGIYLGAPFFYYGGNYCYRRCRIYHGPRYCRRYAYRYC